MTINTILASKVAPSRKWGRLVRSGSLYRPPLTLDEVKVVIIGVKPYGVAPKTYAPKTLKEFIYRWDQDCGYRRRNYDLRSWKRSGILMLPMLPKQTTGIVSRLSHLRRGLLFILWGTRAEKYWKLIDTKKHYIRVKKSENIFLPLTSWRID